MNLKDGSGGENENSILKDMLDFKSTAAREVLFHPVMKTYLDLKWRRVKRYFFFNFSCYVIFLIAYSLFLGNIFYRENKDVRIQVTDLIGLISDQIVFPDSDILSNSNAEVVFPGGAGTRFS